MKNRHNVLIALIALVTLPASSALAASALPPGSLTAQVNSEIGCISPSTCVLTQVANSALGVQPQSASISDAGGLATASARAANQVELKTLVTGSGFGSGGIEYPNFFYAQSLLEYYIEVTGPIDHAPVLLDVTANLQTSASATHGGASGTQADLTLFNGSSPIDFYSSCTEVGGLSCPGGSSPGSVAVNSVVTVSANDLFMVQEFIDGSAQGSGATSSGTADPFLQIDPGFLAGNPGYQLLLSNGVANVLSAVPEPSTWAMMVFGMGGIGAAIRRHRRKPSSVVAAA